MRPSNQFAFLLSPGRWFLGADGLLRPIWRAIVFLALAVFLSALVLGAVRGITSGVPEAVSFAAYYVGLNAVLLLETWLLMSVLDRRSLRTVGLWFYRGWRRELLVGIGIGGGLIAAVVGVMVAGRVLVYQGLAEGGPGTWPRILAIAAVLFLAAVFEEIAFRGYGFQRLVESIGRFWALAVFSALFGLVHLRNPAATPLSTANTILAGVLLAVAYLKTRALWLPIGLHWAWNFFMGPIFSLPVSGMHLDGSLLRVEVSGAIWLSGGTYGPEGSVVLTLGCLAALASLARTRRISVSAAMAEVLKYKEE